MTSTASPRTFAQHVADYALAGWTCILPVPPATKTPPPQGFTGAEGRDTTPEQLVAWAGSNPDDSIALRMPFFPGDEVLPGGWCVIGIDVDQYEKAGKAKHGAQTLAEHVERWGPLPATWSSTARGPGPSRIHLFRAPARRYATRLVASSTGDVEIIQRHHRYAVVWPSFHHDAGDLYRWYDPHGQVQDRPPRPDELAWLPVEWVEGLAEGASTAAAASSDVATGQGLLDQLLDDWRPECADITSARLTAVDALTRADEGSRHDTMTERSHHLVQLAAAGHPGVAHAVLELRQSWEVLTAGEDRGAEFDRALLTSARKAVTAVGATQVPRDPCLLFAGGMPLPPHAPADPVGDGPEGAAAAALVIVEPPRWAGVREAIGAHAFDPNAGLDQSLAEAVLERMYPALRYAYDVGAWLLRAPDRWELYRRLSPWAVAQVAPLMPIGDPTAEKGSDPHERAKRRARLMTAGGAGAIAKTMDALVAAGMHPAAVALADLDADPEILWAGGMPFSLRHSAQGPAFAQVEISTPHLHTGGVFPEVRPTPLWDAFLEAVWPDPELRRWAIRVLSIGITGYADRALPILIGETGRGKTQVIHLLMSVLGTYGHAANPKLLSPASKEHDTIVFDLKGRRLSFIDEAPSEVKAGQERLKQLTGGGELTGRQMNQDPVTFRPTHTLVLTANDEPPLTDPAVRARVRLIPCEGDPELVRQTRASIGHVSGAAWRAEAPGVLAKMMAEAAGWLGEPSSAATASAPANVRYLAEHLGAEQDPVAVWLQEETEPFEAGTPSRELYQAFTASCLRNNTRRDQIPSETKWGRQLTRMGYPSFADGKHKRRQLRISSGGFLPGMTPSPSVDATRQPNPAVPEVISAAPVDNSAGFDSETAGLLPGSEPNPATENVQVNPNESVDTAGFAGFEDTPHTHAHASGAQEERVPTPGEPGFDSVGERPHQEKPKRTTAATEKAAAKREAARREKVAAAAGEPVTLPALVTRSGEIFEVGLDQADAMLGTLDELTVDVENTGYPVGHRDYALRTIQLGGEAFALVLDASDPAQTLAACEHLARAVVLHAHSATADLVPLADAGLLDFEEAWRKMHDTVVLAKLADPASTGSDPGLKQLSSMMLGEHATSLPADRARAQLFRAGKWLTETKVTTPIERSGWAQVDPTCEVMVRYAASDVLDDAAIARLLPRPPEHVLERERLAQRMTARVAYVGLPVDGAHVEELLAEHTAARDTQASLVRSLSGGVVDNPGSGQQVAAALELLGAGLPRTATGKPSVAEAVLTPLGRVQGPAGDLARAVLGYRHHSTALGLFLEPYRELVQHGDGRARPTVYTLAADTGRMSCVRPNLQQVPREGGFRACITADPGHLLVSADFASVELRVAAALSGDRNLRAILDDPDRDVHWETARLAFGPQATKADRYAVKRGVFGRIYGGGVAAIARGVGVEHHVAQAIIDALDALLPDLAEWSRMVRESVASGRTQFATYAGRVVHLDKDLPHKAPNYCIQGTARELLIDALVRWSDTRWGNAVLLPVHDELVVMVSEDEAAAATAALVQCMTNELFGIPIVAEPSEPSFEWKDSQ